MGSNPTSNPETLLPCPFCGNTQAPRLEYEEQHDFGTHVEGSSWLVVCDYNLGGCGASSGNHDHKAGAIGLWARRPAQVETTRKPDGYKVFYGDRVSAMAHSLDDLLFKNLKEDGIQYTVVPLYAIPELGAAVYSPVKST